jgi:hypothetical protein
MISIHYASSIWLSFDLLCDSMMVKCERDCILLHLYGLMVLHLRVVVRMRNKGETETSFLESILF